MGSSTSDSTRRSRALTAATPASSLAPLGESRALTAATLSSLAPLSESRGHFEPRALCSLELLGTPLDAARR